LHEHLRRAADNDARSYRDPSARALPELITQSGRLLVTVQLTSGYVV
jgi:hypothetical protein